MIYATVTIAKTSGHSDVLDVFGVKAGEECAVKCRDKVVVGDAIDMRLSVATSGSHVARVAHIQGEVK